MTRQRATARARSVRRSAGAGVALAFFMAGPAAQVAGARADDVGQIAVIEDTTGRILPASGFCSVLLYPNGLCLPLGGEAFYATHPDEYDMLVFFTNKNLLATEKAGYPLQADVRGIGQDTVPWSWRHFGSAGRLLHAVDLGSVQSMPDDPEGLFGPIPISGLEVIGHEIGHHWMAYANIDLGDGRGSLDIIRGHRDTGTITHWSCWFNSDSVMYGGMLTDNGDGTFTDVNGPRRYSQLDQYLMGLRGAGEVGPLWYVEAGGSLYGCDAWPEAPGVPHDISGPRVDFGMDDVIRALGERDPPSSPCHYKLAFVFVHRPGEPPTTEDLEKVERYRTALEAWYAWATDDRGSLDTRLDGCGTGTPACPGEPSAHCTTPPDDDTDVGGEDEGGGDDEVDAGAEGADAGVDEVDAFGGDVDAGPGHDDGATGRDAAGGDGAEDGYGCRAPGAARGNFVVMACLVLIAFRRRRRCR
jgi:hypothetical protein